MATLRISGELLLHVFTLGKHNLDGIEYEVTADSIPQDAIVIAAAVETPNTVTLTLESRELQQWPGIALTPTMKRASNLPLGDQ